MKNFTCNDHIAYLNKKGKVLRNLILQIPDKELIKILPAPRKHVISQIKAKTSVLADIISISN